MSVVAHAWTLRAVGLLFVSQTLVLGFGCAGKSVRNGDRGDDDSGGTAGTSSGGTSGTAPTGGAGPATGGSGTTGGSAMGGASGTAAGGSAGTATGGIAGSATGGVSGDAGGASGGSAGTGGAAGEAGRPSTSPVECMRATDCSMASDCCGCRSEPILGPSFECPLDCERDACLDMDVDRSEVECSYGRCVIARSCDRRRVTCPALPPSCVDGTVPSVIDDCWGPCLPATECNYVTSCADCGEALCVEFQAQRSSYHCIERADDCNSSENYCGCLGIHCAPCTASDPSVTCACLAC